MGSRRKGVERVLPQARKDELVVQELPEETLVYDLKRHRAFCLNRTAALVWRRCDGRATIPEIATRLQQEFKTPVDDGVVWLALRRLGRARLLKEQVVPPADGTGYSRREMIQRLGLIGGLAVLLPAVQAIIAPTAASAVTCVANNGCTGKPCGTVCKNPGGNCQWKCDGSGNCKSNVSCP